MRQQLPRTVDAQIAPDPTQTRSSPRYPFFSAIVAIDVQASTRIAGRLSDIGRNDCYMDTISPFAPSAVVTLTITREGQTFTTQAQVVYSQIGMGMGLLFTTAEAEQLRMLETWMGELGGGMRSDQTAPLLSTQSDTTLSAGREMREILTELITLLKRKNIMSDSEA